VIITVTLNPAIDRIVYVDSLKENSVNKVLEANVLPGGKGINVSKVIKLLEGDVTATGIIAGRNGEFIEERLKEKEILTDFIYAEGETRVNIKIYDNGKGFTTDLNEVGHVKQLDITNKIIAKVENLASKGSIMVFSGRLPEGLPHNLYSRLIEIAGRHGCKTILDCSGKPLEEGIKAKPFIIKPNINELETILNTKIKSTDEIVKYSREIVKKGVNIVVVSMGADGAVMVGKDYAYYMRVLPVKVKGTVGAGDSMVAALAYALEKKLDAQEMLRLAGVCSAASVYYGSTSQIDKSFIGDNINKVEMEAI